MDKKERIKISIIFLLLFIDLIIFYIFISFYIPKNLQVSFLDVGQGDSIFIETPSRKQIIIDSGYNDRVLEKVASRMSFFDRGLDAVFSTHPDSDHIGGLPGIIKNYYIGSYFDSGATSSSALFDIVSDLLTSNKIKITSLSYGDIIDFGDGVFLEIFWPDENLLKLRDDTNKWSLVMKLTYGDNSFLFVGDAPENIERILVYREEDYLDSDILKVGHHGSKTSSSDIFVSAVSPEYSIISAGKDNKFGHPNIETLKTLEGVQSKILKTFEIGDITFISDGTSIREI